MPRQLRIQYEGAIYHLTSRGDRREEIFRDDLDRKSYASGFGQIGYFTTSRSPQAVFDEALARHQIAPK
jgi:hypothetical protein